MKRFTTAFSLVMSTTFAVAPFGCTDNSQSVSLGADAAGGDAQVDAGPDAFAGPQDPDCSSHTFNVERELPPSGSCVSGATCQFAETGGIIKCSQPNVSYYSGSPVQWDCACSAREWTCNVVGSGLLAIPCPDAGAEQDAASQR
jgi:hypothetical protein